MQPVGNFPARLRGTVSNGFRPALAATSGHWDLPPCYLTGQVRPRIPREYLGPLTLSKSQHATYYTP